MANLSEWLTSFRLHTLPLALSTIICGSFFATYHQNFHWKIAIGATLTTLFLQVLSNLANDYGDMITGVDNKERLGPKRGLQKGSISKKQMKNAIIICILCSLISGIWLIGEAFKNSSSWLSLSFFLLGCGAILAAIKYTMGKNPYGYSGFGDLFVFIFFGLVGVMGTFYLHTQSFSLTEWLPAIAMGCFSTGVLNLNNLRDEKNDILYNKRTLVVQWGFDKAKKYHIALLIIGMLAGIIYVFLIPTSTWRFLIAIPYLGMLFHAKMVWNNKERKDLNKELRNLSLLTLAFSLCLGIGILL